MNIIQFNISGLGNSQQKTAIKNSLDKVDGVKSVKLDMAKSSIEVEYSGQASISEIRQCVEHTGCAIL